ncbi:AI-2E family transporter [Planktothrix mougeotii]|uniref:AI-2E family transporter n=1 Tax=Planktothrix mougeotii LEGE 06226 TaxID=1828728 RepID=A0ABR9UHJ8_9CYAN|nr:AI-2E family transporter [Planktothrix mougeotii]MBE9145938.1 AI-2E family transporter [Planktothrix mougeotii LEGE 06226]
MNPKPNWLKLLLIALVIPTLVLNGWVFLLTLEYFKSIIHIFVTAILLSFLLDYPVQKLQRYGLQRTTAILAVLLITLMILGVLGITLFPIIIQQFNTLIERLPSWIESGNQQIKTFEAWAISRNIPVNVGGVTVQLLERLSSQVQTLGGDVIGGVFTVFGRVLDVVIIAAMTFYLLLHGESLWDDFYQLFPTKIRVPVRRALRKNFKNYFIGQASVAGLLGGFMTLAFFIIQVPFGLLFGMVIGVMAFFPFGGSLGIILVSFLVALNSIWLGVKVLITAIIVDQIVENGIAPRLLGTFTGLNPVLILISLLIGARVAGFLGLIVAVPLASFFKSLIGILQNPSSEAF